MTRIILLLVMLSSFAFSYITSRPPCPAVYSYNGVNYGNPISGSPIATLEYDNDYPYGKTRVQNLNPNKLWLYMGAKDYRSGWFCALTKNTTNCQSELYDVCNGQCVAKCSDSERRNPDTCECELNCDLETHDMCGSLCLPKCEQGKQRDPIDCVCKNPCEPGQIFCGGECHDPCEQIPDNWYDPDYKFNMATCECECVSPTCYCEDRGGEVNKKKVCLVDVEVPAGSGICCNQCPGECNDGHEFWYFTDCGRCGDGEGGGDPYPDPGEDPDPDPGEDPDPDPDPGEDPDPDPTPPDDDDNNTDPDPDPGEDPDPDPTPSPDPDPGYEEGEENCSKCPSAYYGKGDRCYPYSDPDALSSDWIPCPVEAEIYCSNCPYNTYPRSDNRCYHVNDLYGVGSSVACPDPDDDGNQVTEPGDRNESDTPQDNNNSSDENSTNPFDMNITGIGSDIDFPLLSNQVQDFIGTFTTKQDEVNSQISKALNTLTVVPPTPSGCGPLITTLSNGKTFQIDYLPTLTKFAPIVKILIILLGFYLTAKLALTAIRI